MSPYQRYLLDLHQDETVYRILHENDPPINNINYIKIHIIYLFTAASRFKLPDVKFPYLSPNQTVSRSGHSYIDNINSVTIIL